MFVLAMMFVYDSSETNFFRPARRGISDFLLGQLIGGFNDFYWCSTGEDSHVDENLFKSVLKKRMPFSEPWSNSSPRTDDPVVGFHRVFPFHG